MRPDLGKGGFEKAVGRLPGGVELLPFFDEMPEIGWYCKGWAVVGAGCLATGWMID